MSNVYRMSCTCSNFKYKDTDKKGYRYHVQVGLFRTYNSAMILQLRLIDQGYWADINKRGDLFAVHAGDFEEMELAVLMERQLRFLGYNTLLVAV